VLLDGFRGVVEAADGTARHGAFDPEMKVAGKTGSAQRGGGTDAWFVCFAPYDNPEICLVVMLEKAGHGGEEAAPLARLLLEEYFKTKKARQGPSWQVSQAGHQPGLRAGP
jgi:penicillin-binding protein 2